MTHDLGVVAQLCDEMAVIYAGQMVESGPTRRVLDDPYHPYTRALLACHPDRSTGFVSIPGTVPPALQMPSGCRFARAAARRGPACTTRPARLQAVAPDHGVDCILYDRAA